MRVPDFGYRVSGSGIRISHIGYRGWAHTRLESSAFARSSCPEEALVPGFGLRVSDSGFRVTACQISGFGFGVWGFGFRVPDVG